MMTDPRRYLVRMLVFLLIVAAIAGLLHAPLWRAFMGNPVLNGVIVGALGLGIIYAFRQILRLVPERRWLTGIQKTGKLDNRQVKPVLLATVALMIQDGGKATPVSAQNMRSVLDGVAVRLDESREISRYMIGLLVFLGLLGTFWGLLQTIGAVGLVVGSLDTAGTDFSAMMAQLKGGLDAPLSGMATAFSSSLFGLAGSLILGFLDLQLGQAIGRFFNELEDWLSAFARFNDGGPSGAERGVTPLAQGMSEDAARALIHLGNSIAAGEDNRQRVLDQLSNINMTLAALNEAMTDDRRLREQLAQLNAGIAQLSADLQEDRTKSGSAVTAELRALASAINKMAGTRTTRATKGS